MFGEKELQILFHLSKGRRTVGELSECMGMSVSETYRKIRLLRSKDVVVGKDPIGISCCPYAKRLMSIMSEGPGMARYLSSGRLDVLMSVESPQSLNGICRNTGMSGPNVRKILKIHIEGGTVQKINDVYRLNDDDFPKLRPFLTSIRDYLEVSDPRINNESEVIFRKGKDVVFSSSDSQGFRPTGSSAFADFGMKGMPEAVGFFTTESGELSIDAIFSDAVRIAEAENDWRLRMFNELFYIKNKRRLNPPPEFLDAHNRIMTGDRVERWPSKRDIEDRMWMVEG